ncbi:MAG TPA: MBL fold metallo-hydrolase [Longimicrobiales bacterium]|nr:MBL fold metallo-hydrolase [Longimicrobiales bacterium]
MDGTRTYIVGRSRVAVIDPGPRDAKHLNAVADAVGSGVAASVVVTHLHPDHAEGAVELARMLGTIVRALQHDDEIETDEGELRALYTPGHTPDHFSFWWPHADIVFCGDLMMGGLDTALVAVPEGNLAEYMTSLRAIAQLLPKAIYPAHGDPFLDPQTAISRYMRHREERLDQVRSARAKGLTGDDMFVEVYGSDLDPRLKTYAVEALTAYVDYLNEHENH